MTRWHLKLENLPKVVQLLNDKGAKIEIWNKKNKYGWTPLLIAEGHRLGNFKPSFETIAALHRVKLAAGVTPRGFDTWDLWNPTLTTFNERGQTNSQPRMIHANDGRHIGFTSVVFLDGHNDKRRLRPSDLTITLFNPLHR